MSLTSISIFFFFNNTATTEIYPLSLHDALPISFWLRKCSCPRCSTTTAARFATKPTAATPSSRGRLRGESRSEEHTSELQSRPHLVCRLLLEKKKIYTAV